MKMTRLSRGLVWILLISLGSVCSWSLAEEAVSPAFDTSVHASSSITNMQSAALESSLRTSLIGADGSFPEVKYTFSLSSVNKSAPGGAIGSARTEFVVTSLEGRNTYLNTSSERIWRDRTEVTGTITNFLKNFDYTSGIRI